MVLFIIQTSANLFLENIEKRIERFLTKLFSRYGGIEEFIELFVKDY